MGLVEKEEIMAKKCKKCHEWKPYSDYYDERFNMCKTCYCLV